MAPRNESYAAVQNTAGTLTNPTLAGSVMADTGALATGGLYDVRVFVGCSVAAAFSVQHRDTANAVSNIAYPLRAAAGQTGQYLFKFDCKAGERIRVIPAADITGSGEALVQAIRIV